MNQRGFVLPAFFLSPTGIAASAAAIFLASAVIFYILWQGAKDDFMEYKANVLAEQKQLEADAAEARLLSERVIADVSESWSRALDYSRRNRVVRVQSNCDPYSLRPVPSTGLKADATAIEYRPSTVLDASECEDRLNKAVVDAAQVIHLQAFIKGQHDATTKSNTNP